MRDNGMGKSYFEDDILLETRTFIQHVEGCENTTAAMISKWIKLYALNIVWKMVTSKRYDYDDEEVNKIQNLLIDVQTNNMGAFASDIFPILKYIPNCISNAIFGTQVLRNMLQELGSIIQVTNFVTFGHKTLCNFSRNCLQQPLTRNNKKKYPLSLAFNWLPTVAANSCMKSCIVSCGLNNLSS